MVHRIYVEKKPEEALEARSLFGEIRGFLGISRLESLRVLNRYDVQNIDESVFELCKNTVFAEPQLDTVSDTLDAGDGVVFAVEPLPGQFDQRADSAAVCVQIVSRGELPIVRTARVYALYGDLTPQDIAAVKSYVINPVECREASLDTFETLEIDYDVPEAVETLTGFCALDEAGLSVFLKQYSLAMDSDDLQFCRDYFRSERRDPTITELRVIDTYWSDHCRHTTFNTIIDSVVFADAQHQTAWEEYIKTREKLGRTKPITLMDIGTIAAKKLKADGMLCKLDESDEINACTVKVALKTDSGAEDWLLLFKNETHNHPTEIEPFGGAATCIGGAIRDPLSGRSYVYAAMRVSGCADPTAPIGDTLTGKLPQKKIASTAAAGYSSYGNQIGLATGIVDEIYHPGYAAKHMEVGAVIGAAPSKNVRRETPAPGDKIILLGGRTGRDGCGGATGSSKAHDLSSLENCGAEVQKGNAPEERKLQRLFRNEEAARLIKRCNDFGAGGVCVAIGELADGLDIDLDAVPKKYDGLDGTELAISESQERMAVVVENSYVNRFLELAASENLEATVVATVTSEPRLVMRWRGKTVADIARSFLDTNGAPKHINIAPEASKPFAKPLPATFADGMRELVSDLNICSKRGLSERFDSTIGAETVLMPFGGARQLTPIQAMAHKISTERGDAATCSFMAYGYNPFISEKSPYAGAYLAVVESVSKLVAAGTGFEDVYLSFQEYFEKPQKDPARWGKPLTALLGALRAQLGLGVAAIGGKDSMSGSFETLDVPPTLISFAVTTDDISRVVSPEFKRAGSAVRLVSPEYGADGLPEEKSLLAVFETVTALMREGKVLSAWTPVYGGVAEGVFKMCLGNGLGFRFEDSVSPDELFAYRYGSFILEVTEDAATGKLLGRTTFEPQITHNGETLPISDLFASYENKLESVYPTKTSSEPENNCQLSIVNCQLRSFASPVARPRALIPVFPGTNCEYDTAKAMAAAGIDPEIFVIRNLTPDDISRSVAAFAEKIRSAQIIMLPGGFSGGDEPDGSAKLITSFFRNAAITDATHEFLDARGGLMLGICNGFQALIKLGLLPYGRIMPPDANSPTLSFNTIGRHQSKLVRTRVASKLSPWLALADADTVYTVPISHGEGRFLADGGCVEKLAAGGQIATQYVDAAGNITGDIRHNPNGSICSIEGITSPDGRIFGKMGHSERVGAGLYKNVPGNFDMGLFASAVLYYK